MASLVLATTVGGYGVIHSNNIGSQSVSYATSAGSAGSASSAGYSDEAKWISYPDGPRDLSDRSPSWNNRSVAWDFVVAGTANGSGNYGGVMTFVPWDGTSGSTGDSSYQLAFANTTGVNASGQPKLSIRNGINSTWNDWYTLIHSGNIGSQSVSYATSAGSAPNAGNINPFYNVTAGIGNGLRFWAGDDSYKISMGVGGLYQYGPVSDYSIKSQMDAGSTGRGFTWGNNGVTPVAALNATSGNFQVAGTIANGSIWINNGANYNDYNENIRLFDAPNGVSVIAFSASGTGGSPRTSLLGFSDRLETRVSDTWEQRIYGGYVEARGSFRAPIFYDSQDTAYYVDPNGTSNLLKLSTQTMAYNGMNPMSANSDYVGRYNGSVGYRNGTMGFGNTDFNTIFSNWGSGFIDTWSSPVNAPGGSTHYIGLQSIHYSELNTNTVYGFQMACAGEADNRFFWRSSWPGKRNWVEMIHSANFTSWAQEKENQRLSTGNSPTFVDIYANEWFRNNNVNEGLYNQATGTHFYSHSGQGWVVTGSGGTIELQFRSNHQSTLRGYVYADTSNNIGFLNNGGGWSIRTDSSSNAFVHGTTLTISADGQGASNITMNDGDEGNRTIHCNSNKIGFLNQAGSWGSYCSDDGSWSSDTAIYAPIFYDSNDSTYYLDPNSQGLGLKIAGNIEVFARSAAWAEGIRVRVPSTSTWGGIRFTRDRVDYSGNWAIGYTGADSTDDLTFWGNNAGTEGMKMRLDQAANLITYGSMRSPIFYDSADTGYSWNPNTTNAHRFSTPSGYVDIGPMNGSWCHFQTDRPRFYFGNSVTVDGDLKRYSDSALYIHSANYNSYAPTLTGGGASGSWGISVTGSAASAGRSSSLDIVGYGSGNMTYNQGPNTFAGYSGWAGYFISNHGDGATYYNQTIIMPFWSAPQYSRLQGGTFVGPYTFWSTENLNDYAPNMNQYVRTTDNVTFNTTTSPTILVNGHSDNTKGYRIHNTSGSSVSAMFTNSSNQLVIAAGAVDQINLNKKVYVNGVALGVNIAPSATAGRIDASNDIVAYSSSDERLKQNITPIANALDKVKSLTGVEFDWKPEHKEAHGHEGHDTGIIAQQVLGVMPTAVRTNDTGYLAVRYEKLIGLLIEGMKEQQTQIDELKAKLDGLTK